MSELADFKSRTVLGAAAGNLTVTGVKKGDRVIVVQPLAVTATGIPVAGPNLASQFTATADDTINNTGGTSSALQTVLVQWESLGGGRALSKGRTGRSSS